jgi:hypothetical protein
MLSMAGSSSSLPLLLVLDEVGRLSLFTCSRMCLMVE